MAEIVVWVLRQENMSAEKIKSQFRIGNRANKIMDKLNSMGIVSDKHANQPRKVLPQSAEDISEEVMNFLCSNGKTIEDVDSAIKMRNCSIE